MRMPVNVTNALPSANRQLHTPNGAAWDRNGVSSRFETMVWAAAITPDGSTSFHTVTATSGIATAIAIPSGLIPGTRHSFAILNGSGVAMGVVTWAAGYLMPAGFSPPADTTATVLEFEAISATQLRQLGAQSGGGSGAATGLVTPTWGAAVAIDNTLGDAFNVVATSGVAYTYGAPAVDRLGQTITIRFVNSSGGASGAATFNVAYTLLGSAIGALANGVGYTITFLCVGVATWIEVSRDSLLATQTNIVFGRSTAGAGPVEEIAFTAAARAAAAFSNIAPVLVAPTVTLSNAQILTLPTAAVSILAAPGTATLLNLPIAVFYKAIIAGAVTNIDPNATLDIRIGTSVSTMTPVDESAGTELSVLFATVATNHSLKGLTGYSQTPGAFLNSALLIGADNAAAGNFTGGNVGNSLDISIVYIQITP